MAEASQFFETSPMVGGDVGAPKTPKKPKRQSMAAAPPSASKKRKKSVVKKTLAKDPTGAVTTAVTEKKIIPGFNLAPFFLLDQKETKIQREEIIYCEVSKERNIKEPLKMDVYHSYDSKLAKKAAIILVHGGGFGSGDKSQSLYVKMAHEIAKSGFYAFSVNYRLNMGKDTAITDVLKAVEWIKENSAKLSIDKKKIFIAGDSAGGAIAVNVAYTDPEQTRLAGCINLWGGLSPVRPAYTHNPGWDEAVFPLPLGPKVPPTCIIHGTADNVVPISTSQKLSEELNWVRVYNELHILEGAKHYDEKYADKFIPIMLNFAQKVFSGKVVYTEEKINGITTIEVKGLSEASEAAYSNMLILRKATENANSLKSCILVIPKGTYPIRCEVGDKLFDDILTQKIPQRVRPTGVPSPFTFAGMNKIVVEGNGSKLIFNGLIRPFDFNNSKNIEVKNLIIDWERPLFSEGIVRLLKANMLEVDIFPEFPLKGGEPIVSFQTTSPQTGRLTGVCPFTKVSNVQLVAPQRIRFTSSDAKFVKAGEKISIRHSYHLTEGISLFDCENVRIRNLTLQNSCGM